jgi:hypothetical protein
MIENRYDELRDKQKALRDGFSENLGLRVHRALSWIGRAEQAVLSDDFDGAYIFYWIAFNAAYAGEVGETIEKAPSERSLLREYFSVLLIADTDRRIYDALWQTFSGPIRVLLENPYVFAPFWSGQRQGDPESWKIAFDRSAERAMRAFQNGDAKLVLEIVFDRLYVLRNQLMHGGSTYASSVNRSQVSDGIRILGWMVPVFVDLMMDSPEKDWGTPSFPVITD